MNRLVSREWVWVSIPQQRLWIFFDQTPKPLKSAKVSPAGHWAKISPTLLEFSCSTGSQPPSCLENSLGTPWGLHEIADRIGEGEPHGTVFRGRRPTGETMHDLPAGAATPNLITSRILRLRGLEPGVNQGHVPLNALSPAERTRWETLEATNAEPASPSVCLDTWQRYIYLHGTNREDLLGTPHSHGCILMANQTIIDLFPYLPTGTLVYLDPDGP